MVVFRSARPGGYDPTAPSRAVHLSLNSDLLSRVQVFTPDLSATVETLLAKHLETSGQNLEDERQQLDDVISSVNRMQSESGLLSDEFPTT